MPIFSSSLRSSSATPVVTLPLSRTPQLYTIASGSSITFTPCGATGRMGPTLTQARTAYTSQPGFAFWGSNLDLFMVDLGVQYWTVPKTGIYNITAAGASGGPGNNAQGYGAIVQSNFFIEAGEVLRIVVGQRGVTADNAHAGGGGASAVAEINMGILTLLIIGAGGAGVSTNDNNPANRGSRNGRLNDSSGYFGSGNYPGRGSLYQTNYSSYLDYWYGGGGGSWGKDGGRGGIGYWTRKRHPVRNEGKALDNIVPYGGTSHAGHHGGFGGGGGAGVGGGAAAGGGGYQGGDSQYIERSATPMDSSAQGGGSFSVNSYTSSSVGADGNNGQGYVTIIVP